MSLKKLLSVVLSLCLVLCVFGAYAEEDLQAQLDEANARIAELEAENELYKPYYVASLAVEYDGGVITVDEVSEIYNYFVNMFKQYGMDLASSGYDTYYKQMSVDQAMTERTISLKAAELGLDVLDEETETTLREEAAKTMQSFLDSYVQNYYEDPESVTEEDLAAIKDGLATQYGYTEDKFYEEAKASAVTDAVKAYIVKDVTVSDEDVQAKYDAMVEDAQSNFSDSSYVNSVASDENIVWHPEGYRMIKQVLVKFDDDQSQRYSELNSTLNTLNAEKDAIENPTTEETAEETAEETTEETAETTDEAAAETTEEAPAEETRTLEQVEADIAAVQSDIDALYEELMPRVNEVVDAFNAGTSFDELIATYNEDTGMPEAGYPVCAESTWCDPVFRDSAMGIEEIGGIGEPGRGSYGIYITYYSEDVTSGAVSLDVVRDYVTETALTEKQNELIDSTITEWTSSLNPIYHYENVQ